MNPESEARTLNIGPAESYGIDTAQSSDVSGSGSESEDSDSHLETLLVASFNQDTTETRPMDKRERMMRRRNLASFWIFGLCNNFAYVVMLTAAHDILADHSDNNNNSNHTSGNSSSQSNKSSEYLECNAIGTGAILLADILPTLIVKFTFPFFIQSFPYSVKIALIGLFSAVSFVIVSSAHQLWLSILGVVCASFGSGLGEITFLSLTTFYDKNVVSSWSSGTGGAGVLGALAYAGFTSAGLSARVSLLIMISVPVFMIVTYKFVLGDRYSNPNEAIQDGEEATTDDTLSLIRGKHKENTNTLSMGEKFRLVPSLFKYMIPLSLVYFAEYFINQGLHEILYFNGEFLSKKEQYRWFQVDYQIGVFISRSSVNLFKIRKLWILPVLQFANMALLIFQVFYRFIPSLWIILAIILWEGLLGGAAYVNTFYLMSTELSSDIKEYCMGIATVADSFGIAIAGAIAVPTHNRICNLNIKM